MVAVSHQPFHRIMLERLFEFSLSSLFRLHIDTHVPLQLFREVESKLGYLLLQITSQFNMYVAHPQHIPPGKQITRNSTYAHTCVGSICPARYRSLLSTERCKILKTFFWSICRTAFLKSIRFSYGGENSSIIDSDHHWHITANYPFVGLSALQYMTDWISTVKSVPALQPTQTPTKADWSICLELETNGQSEQQHHRRAVPLFVPLTFKIILKWSELP